MLFKKRTKFAFNPFEMVNMFPVYAKNVRVTSGHIEK